MQTWDAVSKKYPNMASVLKNTEVTDFYDALSACEAQVTLRTKLAQEGNAVLHQYHNVTQTSVSWWRSDSDETLFHVGFTPFERRRQRVTSLS
jgi:hypothetical protein